MDPGTSRTDWKLSQAVSAADLEQCLPKKMSCCVLQKQHREMTVLDDFYWHIWQSGAVLTSDQETGLNLWQVDDPCLELPAKAQSRFWWQLPAGELTERLKELLGLHAFVAKSHCQLTSEPLLILNADEKIVCRAQLFRLRGELLQESFFITISSLRGYGKEYAAIIKAFSVLGPEPIASLDLRTLLQAGGLVVDLPAETDDYQLSPAELAEAAVCKMAKRMLLSARRFEQGLIDDIDTEFVHQYRVNIRKTRSLISLFKKTLATERYEQLKNELKTLGSRTNDLRDLDVFLLDEAAYREMLPENLQAGLTPIFSRIKRRRTMAWKKTVAALQSTDYQNEVGLLFELLDAEPDWSSKQAQLPIKQLVCKKVLAQYRKICTAGALIDGRTADEAVHDLRIECKKLRYLLELFTELFSRKKIKRLIRHLKGLQNNLGQFNDYSVQQEFLHGVGRSSRTISAEQLASINGLIAVLYNKQLNERSQVEENIAKFIAPNVAEEFRQLFAQPAEELTK